MACLRISRSLSRDVDIIMNSGSESGELRCLSKGKEKVNSNDQSSKD
jgi:hypothetical protein